MKAMYHYKEIGLPNVYLQNGYELVDTPYGRGVTIHEIDALHLALARAIVLNSAPLTGPEFRFLRQELELSQAGLGRLLGRDEQAVARWEKGRSKQVDPIADRMLRFFYAQTKLGDKKLATVLTFLQELEAQPPSPKGLVANERGATWKVITSAECA